MHVSPGRDVHRGAADELPVFADRSSFRERSKRQLVRGWNGALKGEFSGALAGEQTAAGDSDIVVRVETN